MNNPQQTLPNTKYRQIQAKESNQLDKRLGINSELFTIKAKA